MRKVAEESSRVAERVSERSIDNVRALRSEEDANDLVEAVERGEKTLGAASAEVQRRKLPTPKEANRLAAETGTPVVAFDERIYTGRPEAEVQAESERVQRVARILDALKALAADAATEVIPLVPWYQVTDVEGALPGAEKFIRELREGWSDREDR